MEQQKKTNRTDELMEIARLRFGMIAPVIQETYPDESVMAYCRRVAQTQMRLPDGRIVKYKPKTIGKWVSLYRNGGIDALTPKTRSDLGKTWALTGETPLSRYLHSGRPVRKPKSPEWLDECFLNRATCRVSRDATVELDSRCYDAPMQFIGQKVEVPDYIRQKIRNAGGSPEIIDTAAISSVHSYSQGNPRLIDNVMTDAMTLGSQMEKKVIDAEVMLSAINNQALS